MKKYFTSILVLLFTFSVFAQDNEKLKAYYSKLSKQNRTAGRILLYGGAGLVVLPFVFDAFDDKGRFFHVSYLGFPIGIISMIVSTTYFNRAVRYKKKMASISFINQPLEIGGVESLMARSSKHNGGQQIKNSRLFFKTIPAVSLKINL